MPEPKTRPTGASVAEFLDAVADETRRQDCRTLDRIMRRVTGKKPLMWGPSIVGYDTITLTYASGRTLDWPPLSFSPRKQSLVVYLSSRVLTKHAALLKRVGKRSGQVCLSLTRLEGADLGVLEKLCEQSYAESLAKNRGAERRSPQSERRAR